MTDTQTEHWENVLWVMIATSFAILISALVLVCVAALGYWIYDTIRGGKQCRN